jgi:hypothetical protein
MSFDWIKYANQRATRSLPLNDQLTQAMGFLPEMGVTMEVFSGGQPAKGSGGPRVGSVRHDHGNAADVFFYKDGRRLDWSNPQDLPIYQDIVRRAKQAGLTGFGAGPGYMQPGSMHIGYGAPGVWGAGGSSRNAPSWLVEAYGGAPAGKPMPSFAQAAAEKTVAPTMANMQNKSFDPVGEVMGMAAPTAAPQGLASMFAPPGPAMPGAEVAGAPVPPTLGALAALFAQQQTKRNEERAAEAEAEQMRRAALFGPDSLAGLFGAA